MAWGFDKRDLSWFWLVWYLATLGQSVGATLGGCVNLKLRCSKGK
jgi:hypothetical protein